MDALCARGVDPSPTFSGEAGCEVQNCVPSIGTKEMLLREHGAMFAVD